MGRGAFGARVPATLTYIHVAATHQNHISVTYLNTRGKEGRLILLPIRENLCHGTAALNKHDVKRDLNATFL